MPNMTGRLEDMNGGSSAPYGTSLVPLAFTCFLLCLIDSNRVGSRRGFRLPSESGIVPIVRWNLRPVIFGVDICRLADPE